MRTGDDLRLALDPVAWASDALGFIADPWQAHALTWAGKRMLLNCTRQAGKSTVSSILALHGAIYRPGSLTIMVSPSQRQSSELFLKVSSAVKRLPVQPKLDEDNKLSLRLDNGSRIVSLPSSEATIRGYSAVDLIIEDEASKVPDDLYRAVRPMLAVSNGRLLLMSTPFGKRGHFHREWTEGGDVWERVEITADKCPRISPEFLAEERASMGEWWFRQEYMCEFVETDDQLFGFDLVMRAVRPDVEPLFGVTSCDAM